jgi:hypothetical protein
MPWSVASYNTNPDLNNTINGVDIGEGADAAGYNNALRQIMADIATWVATQALVTPISIAQGGTGQSTAPNALAALNGLDTSYRDLVRVDKSASFAISNAERGYGIFFTGATGTVTINPQSSTVINPGAVYQIWNAGGTLTFTPGASVSLFKNGSTSSASAVLGPRGLATLVYWGGDQWTITGANVT